MQPEAAATAIFFSASEPSVTAVSSRPRQARSRVLAELPRAPGSTVAVRPLGASIAVACLADFNPGVQTAADKAVGMLIKLGKLEDNWDGFGAAKPSALSIEAARRFVRRLAPESIVPEATLHADGNAILFYRSGESYAELEFIGADHVEYLARRGDEEWCASFSRAGDLPVELREIGFLT